MKGAATNPLDEAKATQDEDAVKVRMTSPPFNIVEGEQLIQTYGFNEKDLESAINELALSNGAQPQPTPQIGEDLENLTTKEKKVFVLLKETLQASGAKIDPRSALGQIVVKAMQKDTDYALKLVTADTHEKKATLRLEYAEKWKGSLQEKVKSEVQSYEEKQELLGRWLPFGMIVESYGILYDRKHAVECATKYCSKAAQMGSKWCCWDGMGETALFRKVEVQDTEIMSKQWSITKTQKLNAAMQGAAPPAALQDAAPPDVANEAEPETRSRQPRA